jgi:hypothetical protein
MFMDVVRHMLRSRPHGVPNNTVANSDACVSEEQSR